MSTRIDNAIFNEISAALCQMIREECDLGQCSEKELPQAKQTFLKGARRLAGRIAQQMEVENEDSQ